MKKTGSILLTILMMIGGSSAIAQDQSLSKFLKQLPAGANTVLIADLATVRESGVATKNQWFDSNSGKMDSGMGFLPHATDGVILASQMDLEALNPTWTAGLLFMKKIPDLESVSQQTHGKMDTMAGMDVVETSTDLFVFKTGGGLLATFSPANRQMLAPWFTSLKNNQPQAMSEFLNNSIDNRDTNAGLFISFDMTNLVSPASVLTRAKDADVLKSNGIDPEKFSAVIASVQGVTVEVTFTTGINASAKIQFGEDAKILEPVAKKLILEVMDNHGLSLSNLANWEATVGGNHVKFSGELSTTGLRRLISLFDAPDPHMTTASSSADPSAAPSAADSEPVSAGAATKKYFDAVTSIVAELRKDIGVGGQSGYKYGKWFETYADKIDNLDMRNVDADMLDFGANVSQSFRQINLQITNSHHSTDIRDSNLMTSGIGSPAYRYRRGGYGYAGYGYGYARPWGYYGGNGWGGYGGWGYGAGGEAANRAEVANNLQVRADRTAIHKQSRIEAASFGAQVFTNISDAEGNIRREMVQKYPDNFK